MPALVKARWIATDLLPAPARDGQPAAAAPQDIALLQYTSGSTAEPRGVMISHRNLMHNERIIQTALEHSGPGLGVTWLPPYHDLGLIGGILQNVYHGATCIVMSPLVLLPVAAIGGAPAMPAPDGIIALVAVALVSTALAWPLYFRVLSHTTPMAASSVTFVVPAFGMLWGALALGEPVGIGLVAGFGLVSVSLVLVLGLPLPSFRRLVGPTLSARLTPA